MGIFSEYGKRLNNIATSAFNAYKEAAQKAEIAEIRYNVESDPHKDPVHNNYQQQAIAARAKAAMLEAQQALRDAQQFMVKEIESVEVVGRELKAAVFERFCANGEQVNIGTLELLKSGILKSEEYIALFDKANKDGNQTMMRLIGRYAGEAAPKAPTKELEIQLQQLASTAKYSNGREYIDAYNAFVDAYSRTARTPAMIDRWDEITAGILSVF